MKDRLAEELLARVMNWSPGEVATYLPPLQAIADYKYDEYQQFSPGMRFIESLALWLSQFSTPAERVAALDFVRNRLIFISNSEINHLVSISYPDYIRPVLLSMAAAKAGFQPWDVGEVSASVEFRALQRRSLFLGLSDGARMDIFRRANPTLSHEQIRQSHELSDERVDSLLGDLKRDLQRVLGEEPTPQICSFLNIVLMDDFSGSGLSYLRAENGKIVGKIGKFFDVVTDRGKRTAALLAEEGAQVTLALYMATERARDYLTDEVQGLFAKAKIGARVIIVHTFPRSLSIQRGDSSELDAIVDKYYDSSIEDSSTRLGRTDMKFGFSGCGLPLILSHNTPNNSIGLLWADCPPKMRALFPRVTRHKDTL